MRIKIEWLASTDPPVDSGTATIKPEYIEPLSFVLPTFTNYMRLRRLFEQEFNAGRASKTADIKRKIDELVEMLDEWI